jgi:hypothetical protein
MSSRARGRSLIVSDDRSVPAAWRAARIHSATCARNEIRKSQGETRRALAPLSSSCSLPFFRQQRSRHIRRADPHELAERFHRVTNKWTEMSFRNLARVRDGSAADQEVADGSFSEGGTLARVAAPGSLRA